MFVVIDSLTMRVSTLNVRGLSVWIIRGFDETNRPIWRIAGRALPRSVFGIPSRDVRGKMESAPDQQMLQSKVFNLSTELKTTVFELVDDLLIRPMHDFLFAIQECHDHDMGIEVVVDGKPIAEQSDGLHGEIFGCEGWIVRFSKFPAEKEIAGSLESAKFISEMLKRIPEEESSGQ